jgi:transposase InsO family protein
MLPEDEDEETRRLMDQLVQRFPYLREFADVCSKRESDRLPPHRECDHRIELTGQNPLKTSPLYSLTLDQLEAMKRYLVDNLRKGFIEPSGAPFGSPVLFAKKHDGSWRFCVDYRRLNAATVKDKYPLPLIDETLRQLGKAKIFSKLDIRQAFHRVRMDPGSEDLTTFRTRYGQFRYKVLPFGLTNGPATFQRFINSQVFEYLDEFVTAFVDDLIIYSDNEEEHIEHVKAVLRKLRAAGLQVDLKKCEFHTTETKFLGFIVNTEGTQVDPLKIEAVTAWERPQNVRGVQAFLGFCNFYRRFVEGYGRIARPLQRLTAKDTPFRWTPECQEAFDTLKLRMTTTPLLAHYVPERETRMETDASDGVVAGVLSQMVDGQWRPVAYFSKAMSGPECNYPIHDKELLAIVRGIEEWYPLLMGARGQIEVLTDHHALQYFMTKKLLNARQAGWSELLAPLDFQIKYRPGKQNAAADALSRKAEDLTTQKAIQEAYRTQILLPAGKVDPRILEELDVQAEEATPEDHCRLCQLQATAEGDQPQARLQGYELTDEVLRRNRLSEGLESFREIAKTGATDWTLREDGLLVKGGRLVVPADDNLRTHLLAEFHEQLATAHPGRNKMRALVSRQYYWPGMMSDIDRYVRNCLTCRRSHKPRDRPPGLLKPAEVPARTWQHVTMDFHAMPRDRLGYDQVFVVVDRLGKRCYSLPCYKTTAAKEMARLYYRHIWRTHGTPESITSDRGPQFISDFWDEFCKILGVKLRLSSAEHPQTDGQTEIMNQYLDQRLRPFVNHFQDDWSELLPAMDFAQAVLPHESTGMAPIEVETGHLPRMSYDWEERTREFSTPTERLNRTQAQGFVSRIDEAVRFAQDSIRHAQEAQRKQADKHRRKEDFGEGSWVMVTKGKWQTDRPSDKLDFPVAGPFKILRKKGDSYLLDLPNTWKIHPVFTPDRLRKAPTDPLPGQELHPQPPEEIDGELEWQVDRITGSRLNKGRLEYRVQWTGWDEDPIWYPARNFKNSPHVLRTYHEEFPNAAGPPKRLAEWTDAYLKDTIDEDHADDDLPEDSSKTGPTRSRRRRKP